MDNLLAVEKESEKNLRRSDEFLRKPSKRAVLSKRIKDAIISSITPTKRKNTLAPT